MQFTFERDLPKEAANCPYCPWTGLYMDYNDHAVVCCNDHDLNELLPACDETSSTCLKRGSGQTQTTNKKIKGAVDPASKRNETMELRAEISALRNDAKDAERKHAKEKEELHAMISSLQRSVRTLHIGVRTLRRQSSGKKSRKEMKTEAAVQEIRLRSNDSSYIWHLEDCLSAFMSADCIESEPFSSGKYGYKLKACLSNNRGRGSHVSMMLAVMCGQYDDYLPWPFRQKIKVAILPSEWNDYQVQEIQIVPDTARNWELFDKPSTDQNEFYVVERFCRRQALQVNASLKFTVQPYSL